jgi:hypothetical protein
MKRVVTPDKIQGPLREMRPVSRISDSKGQKEGLSTVLVGIETAYLGPRSELGPRKQQNQCIRGTTSSFARTLNAKDATCIINAGVYDK